MKIIPYQTVKDTLVSFIRTLTPVICFFVWSMVATIKIVFFSFSIFVFFFSVNFSDCRGCWSTTRPAGWPPRLRPSTRSSTAWARPPFPYLSSSSALSQVPENTLILEFLSVVIWLWSESAEGEKKVQRRCDERVFHWRKEFSHVTYGCDLDSGLLLNCSISWKCCCVLQWNCTLIWDSGIQ